MTGVIKGKYPFTYWIDGREVSKEVFDEAFPSGDFGCVGGTSSGIRNHPSDALAVHPDQIKEFMEEDRKRGVPSEYLPDGRLIIRDRAHQKKYLKAYNYYNRDGGYGD